ncbi:MAG: hypothetical protein ACJ8FP_08790 [Xanthobacteraceae bacterium]
MRRFLKSVCVWFGSSLVFSMFARYPQETVKSGAKGNKMFSAGWHGHSKVLGGTSDGDVVFCLEDIAKKMMKDGIIEMKKDFADR